MGRVFTIEEPVLVYYVGEWREGTVISHSLLNRRLHGEHDPAVYYVVMFPNGSATGIYADHGIMPANASEEMKDAYVRLYAGGQ